MVDFVTSKVIPYLVPFVFIVLCSFSYFLE